LLTAGVAGATHLRQSGFEVFLAANGEEAIYQASLHQPEVVVLHLAMPGVDGLETLMRGDEENPNGFPWLYD
jgi:DNA-binding response OmpR family regulator|tara:strand:+ start:322 stop:537 length:216 start_codon:yes stop_codon:yes gene_type:complete